MNQAWLRRFDTKKHDYSRRRDLAYSPEHGDGAHGDFLFDLGGDKLGVRDTRLIIGEDGIGRETMVIF